VRLPASFRRVAMSRYVIVVPCFNEAARLPVERFTHFARRHPNAHFLLVNDGSSDDTRTVLEELRRQHPRQFDAHHLPRNRGKAEAVRQGCLAAFERHPDRVGYWDADLATPLDAVPEFLHALDENPHVELVCGARVKLMGRAIHRQPARHYLGRVFSTVASWALGLNLYDTQCGAKLFRATPRMKLAFARPFLTRWLFDIEILSRLSVLHRHNLGAAIDRVTYELPLREWRDVAGSKVKAGDFFIAFAELIRIHRHYFRTGLPLESVFDAHDLRLAVGPELLAIPRASGKRAA
jgi:dolichyl-phosphate beta-glucosyltransferase